MTTSTATRFRDRLRALASRVQDTAAGLEAAARSPTSGESGGGLSNAPMHLGDVGSEVYTQELNATLLENEDFIRSEVAEALGRIDAGTFGTCERCGKAIPAERLDAIPYARHCVACAGAVQSGKAVNLNDGRPREWAGGYAKHDTGEPHGGVAEQQIPDEAGREPEGKKPKRKPAAKKAPAKPRRGKAKGPAVATFTDLEPQPGGAAGDVHAAGTAGGGTAVGGLAGTNGGTGDPADDLEGAMGSGNFDVTADGDREVGSTPANKRSAGGRARRDRG